MILLLALPPTLMGGYGAWFLWDGYRRDPVMRLVGEMVREDGMARQVLGSGAVVTGMEGNFFSWMPGHTSHSYVVTLQGPKGEGRLAVTSHRSSFEGPKLDTPTPPARTGGAMTCSSIKHCRVTARPGRIHQSKARAILGP